MVKLFTLYYVSCGMWVHFNIDMRHPGTLKWSCIEGAGRTARAPDSALQWDLLR